ncbi:hypothetical protein [Actinomadura miaoliensis]|uniref:DUF397 domain-containing protein n=1 Tax=Actinomadura miaoliensis TaxID=430685 RepID=A0ABP7UWW4_9ACTN
MSQTAPVEKPIRPGKAGDEFGALLGSADAPHRDQSGYVREDGHRSSAVAITAARKQDRSLYTGGDSRFAVVVYAESLSLPEATAVPK